MNKDLKDERDQVPFEIEELTNFYYGGADKVKRRRFFEKYFYEDPELMQDLDVSYLSHVEKYENAVKKLTIILRKVKELIAQGQYGKEIYPELMSGFFFKHLIREGNPSSVHFDMFIPAIMNMGTKEQQDEWLPRAWDYKIIGSYVQTEIGHGTFVRGLETTATYDTQTKEFVINSPTLSSFKFWPGGLGHTANYAMLMARLILKGKDYGIHGFIVQLRDEETHKPMRGVTIGEVGTKFGFNSVNNGFLGLKEVRIPRKNLLMKNSEVTENGEYIKHRSALLSYGTMTMTRVGIIMDANVFHAKAATIAVRYSLVRRQSPIEPDKPEPKIIDHVTQQYKILPVVARVYVINLASRFLWNMHDDVMQQIEKGDLSRLPELHGLSCCLKAMCTDEAAQGAEICRLSCGGHGYLNSSGFPDIYKMITPGQTYEGENTILYLQTARYLLKTWQQIIEGSKVTSTVAYLKNFVARSAMVPKEVFDTSPRGILRALQSATAGKVGLAYKNLEEKKKTMSAEEAANQCGIQLVRIGQLHAKVFMLQTAVNELEKAARESSPKISYTFRDILELYAVDVAKSCLGDLMQFVDVTSASTERLQARLESALKRVRKYAIGLVDALDFPDYILNSTLGAYDGNVYERLIEAAKKSPLNQEDVNKSFHLYLKPFMKSNL